MSLPSVVYVVDSDEGVGEALAALLGTYEIEVRSFADAEAFLAAGLSEVRGCLLLAENLPGQGGISLLRQLRRQEIDIPIIVLTNTVDPVVRDQALRFGATDVLQKPLMNAFVVERLSALLPDSVAVPITGSGAIRLRDGRPLTIRVIRPEDASLEQAFVAGLSARTKYLRFFSGIKELTPRMLDQFTHPNYPETYAPIATVVENGRERIVAVARYSLTEVAGCADFAVVVADRWQRLGIAETLLQGLTVAAVVAGIDTLEGLVLRDNHPMRELAKKLGFKASAYEGDMTMLRVVKHLRAPTPLTL